KLLFQAVRYTPKGFNQRRPDGAGGWIYKLDGAPRVLYRLRELMAADLSAPVFLVEGEKDVERLRAGGLVATCSPMGAGRVGGGEMARRIRQGPGRAQGRDHSRQ